MITALTCLFCGTSLEHGVHDHNASACPYKRKPEPPHQFQDILPTRRLPRWIIMYDRNERDELRGHHG